MPTEAVPVDIVGAREGGSASTLHEPPGKEGKPREAGLGEHDGPALTGPPNPQEDLMSKHISPGQLVREQIGSQRRWDGLSQAELAFLAGVDNNVVSRIENEVQQARRARDRAR
jgi:ribosome-binding protein aMBF1 (putative translation factor)